MKQIFVFLLFVMLFAQAKSQGPYAPPVGQPGTTAMYKDSSDFVAWAINCVVIRGWQDIADTTLGKTSVGTEQDATQKAGVNGVVSLGDGGEAVLTFGGSIYNGPGPDFAVFENSFSDSFLELAFVEVSSDGQNFVRFPAHSLTQDTVQVDGFGTLDATNIHNLAGKYRAAYGTPFDLDDLAGVQGVDVNNITHIKIIDVVGSINDSYATYDTAGNKINDPYPTPFASGGFDLDAVGVIHFSPNSVNEFLKEKLVKIISQSDNYIEVLNNDEQEIYCDLFSATGQVIFQNKLLPKGKSRVTVSNLSAGIYFLVVQTYPNIQSLKFIKR